MCVYIPGFSILLHGFHCKNWLYSFDWYGVTYQEMVIMYWSAKINLSRQKCGIFGCTYCIIFARLTSLALEKTFNLYIYMPQSNAINTHLACALGAKSAMILLLISNAFSWNEKGMNISNYYLWALNGQWVNIIPPQISICPNVHSTQIFVSMAYRVHYFVMCYIIHHLIFFLTLLTFIPTKHKPMTINFSNALMIKSGYILQSIKSPPVQLVARFYHTWIWRTM